MSKVLIKKSLQKPNKVLIRKNEPAPAPTVMPPAAASGGPQMAVGPGGASAFINMPKTPGIRDLWHTFRDKTIPGMQRARALGGLGAKGLAGLSAGSQFMQALDRNKPLQAMTGVIPNYQGADMSGYATQSMENAAQRKRQKEAYDESMTGEPTQYEANTKDIDYRLENPAYGPVQQAMRASTPMSPPPALPPGYPPSVAPPPAATPPANYPPLPQVDQAALAGHLKTLGMPTESTVNTSKTHSDLVAQAHQTLDGNRNDTGIAGGDTAGDTPVSESAVTPVAAPVETLQGYPINQLAPPNHPLVTPRPANSRSVMSQAHSAANELQPPVTQYTTAQPPGGVGLQSTVPPMNPQAANQVLVQGNLQPNTGPVYQPPSAGVGEVPIGQAPLYQQQQQGVNEQGVNFAQQPTKWDQWTNSMDPSWGALNRSAVEFSAIARTILGDAVLKASPHQIGMVSALMYLDLGR